MMKKPDPALLSVMALLAADDYSVVPEAREIQAWRKIAPRDTRARKMARKSDRRRRIEKETRRAQRKGRR